MSTRKRIISTLVPKLSAGWDGIPSIVLKYLFNNVISILSYILTYLYHKENLSPISNMLK